MTETQQGVVLEATCWGDELKAVDLVPYRMDAALRAPSGARRRRRRQILADVWSTSTGPFRVPLSQATVVRAARDSCARSTTAGTSPALW